MLSLRSKGRAVRIPRKFLGTLLTLFLVVATAPAVRASHYTAPAGHPNDKAHLFWYGNLNQTWINIVNWSRTNNIDPTSFDSGWLPGHDGSDAAVGIATLAGAYGSAPCGGWSSLDPGMCDHYHVTLDHTDALTLDQQRTVTCHELGHTLGLGHRLGPTSECMWPTSVPAGSNRFYDSHDVSEIDVWSPPGWWWGTHYY